VVTDADVTDQTAPTVVNAHLSTPGARSSVLDEADFVEFGPDSLVMHRRREDARTALLTDLWPRTDVHRCR